MKANDLEIETLKVQLAVLFARYQAGMARYEEVLEMSGRLDRCLNGEEQTRAAS